MSICLLGLGSNLNTPKRQLHQAIRAIRALPQTHCIAVAPFYRNPPFGKKTVPDFYNTVVWIRTHLAPFILLQACQNIEQLQGRARRGRYAARSLDIDILTYGNIRLKHPLLTLPHPQMHQRDFVQIPMKSLHKSGQDQVSVQNYKSR